MWCGGSAAALFPAALFPGAANNHCIIADHFPPDKTETLGESAGFGEILGPFWGRLAHSPKYRFYAGDLPAKITQILISRWWSRCLHGLSFGSFQWPFPGAFHGHAPAHCMDRFPPQMISVQLTLRRAVFHHGTIYPYLLRGRGEIQGSSAEGGDGKHRILPLVLLFPSALCRHREYERAFGEQGDTR